MHQILHTAPFCNRNVHTCTHFCNKITHSGIWDCYAVGFIWQVWGAVDCCQMPRGCYYVLYSTSGALWFCISFYNGIRKCTCTDTKRIICLIKLSLILQYALNTHPSYRHIFAQLIPIIGISEIKFLIRDNVQYVHIHNPFMVDIQYPYY